MGSKKNQTAKAKCQCYDKGTQIGCNNSPMKGSLFCAKHQNCPMSPLSGSEPARDAELYNKASVRRCHNCYSYAMHVYDPKGEELCKKYGNCRNFFHQPGAKTGHRNELNREERRSCPVVEDLMMGDIPEVTRSSFAEKCPAGMSKVAAVVDKGVDYHWYRQDRNGMWSHKDGSNKVKTFDALKRPIFNPELASRDYRANGSDLNYEDFCGFYCVPRDRPVVLGRGVNVPKSRRAQRATRKAQRAQKTQRSKKEQNGGQHAVAIPVMYQTGRGYDIRLDSLPSCPPQEGAGYDIRLNDLPSCPPPQSGMGLSWNDYPPHSTNVMRKRYSQGTRSLKHRQI